MKDNPLTTPLHRGVVLGVEPDVTQEAARTAARVYRAAQGRVYRRWGRPAVARLGAELQRALVAETDSGCPRESRPGYRTGARPAGRDPRVACPRQGNRRREPAMTITLDVLGIKVARVCIDIDYVTFYIEGPAADRFVEDLAVLAGTLNPGWWRVNHSSQPF